MSYGVLIVAAGRGTRAGGSLPKQFRMLGGKTVLHHAIDAMLAHPKVSELWIVVNVDDQPLLEPTSNLISDHRFKGAVIGGATRRESVRKGLAKIKSEHVLIHDGARPLLPYDALDRVITALITEKAAFCALPATDAMWQIDGSGLAALSLPREQVWRAQTPQAFRTNDIIKAHEQALHNTDDDVGIALSAGIIAQPVMGSEQNIKITGPDDFARAAMFMEAKMDVRLGTGYDVHAFCDGDHVILNGIKIPHSHAMLGHSDADVAMHAITDALFGAIAKGDIGQWFPPSDPQWKGAASSIFLKKAVDIVRSAGFTINNIDCTIICELPKIAPHTDAMRKNLANIIGIDAERVSVKATTSEKLGFTGRAEGIAAQASAVVVK